MNVSSSTARGLAGHHRTAATARPAPTHLSTPASVRKRGFVWLGAALLAVVLSADV